ncbi:hypothetical protein [Gilvimarinus sp. 1_MG-2023]|uniref:hypothetical protein n=1 Tax=Gilvimarinus sp. 1_MG-2023 TaxID=3062638 RepID=UPI0026E44266|nr:hypothetical protein [Gilvimarinus sp. 1_MG-2023]MDO6747196.1 hypothetical protein [Gilvimarinus sp. 1_MG-2023]
MYKGLWKVVPVLYFFSVYAYSDDPTTGQSIILNAAEDIKTEQSFNVKAGPLLIKATNLLPHMRKHYHLDIQADYEGVPPLEFNREAMAEYLPSVVLGEKSNEREAGTNEIAQPPKTPADFCKDLKEEITKLEIGLTKEAEVPEAIANIQKKLADYIDSKPQTNEKDIKILEATIAKSEKTITSLTNEVTELSAKIAKTPSDQIEEISNIIIEKSKKIEAERKTIAGAQKNIQALKEADKLACTIDKAKASAQKAIDSTIFTKEIQVKSSQMVTVTLSRGGKELSKAKSNSKDNGFVTHVGFTFIDNRGTSWYSKREEVQGDDGIQYEYRVAKQGDQDSILFAPTIMFTYQHLMWGPDDRYSAGPTGGIGVNQSDIFAYAGYSLIFNTNLMFSAGVAFQEFDELNGTYEENQKLDAAVDSDILTGSSINVGSAVSIGFRFAF